MSLYSKRRDAQNPKYFLLICESWFRIMVTSGWKENRPGIHPNEMAYQVVVAMAMYYAKQRKSGPEVGEGRVKQSHDEEALR